MVEHNMQQACLAAFSFDTSHQLITSNMETGAPGCLEQVPTSKWRSVLVCTAHTSTARVCSHPLVCDTVAWVRFAARLDCNSDDRQVDRHLGLPLAPIGLHTL